MVFTLVLALGEMLAAAPRDPTSHALQQLQPQVGRSQANSMQPMNQLYNPRTGVGCTMRVLEARPVDPQATLPPPEDGVDPDIRGRRVSPCVD
jgi:hypothetical protein